MLKDEVYAKITPLFRDIFEDDELSLYDEMTADDVDGWDSLSHIRMMLALEQAFKIRFSAAQVSNLANLGELVALIQAKCSSAMNTA